MVGQVGHGLLVDVVLLGNILRAFFVSHFCVVSRDKGYKNDEDERKLRKLRKAELLTLLEENMIPMTTF